MFFFFFFKDQLEFKEFQIMEPEQKRCLLNFSSNMWYRQEGKADLGQTGMLGQGCEDSIMHQPCNQCEFRLAPSESCVA